MAHSLEGSRINAQQAAARHPTLTQLRVLQILRLEHNQLKSNPIAATYNVPQDHLLRNMSNGELLMAEASKSGVNNLFTSLKSPILTRRSSYTDVLQLLIYIAGLQTGKNNTVDGLYYGPGPRGDRRQSR